MITFSWNMSTWDVPTHPCSEKGYWMTGRNWTHLRDLRVWNQDKTILQWTLPHVTGVFWSLSYFVGTEPCFYTIKLAVPSLDINDPTQKLKIVMNFRLWNQDKNKLINDILTFCGPLLVYCCFVGTEIHIFCAFLYQQNASNSLNMFRYILIPFSYFGFKVWNS